MGLLVALGLLAACARNPFPQSEGHIPPPDPKAAKAEEIPPLVESTTLLPPPKAQPREELYTVVVHDVPVRDLLFSLARDAKINVDIHPTISGIVSLNAVEQPLTQILDRIAAQVSLRYAVKNGALSIQPDSAYWKVYKIEFPSLERKAESELSTKLEVGSASGGTSGGGGGNSSSKITTKSDNEFWIPLINGITNIIYADRERIVEEKAVVDAAAAKNGEEVATTVSAPAVAPSASGTMGSKEVVVHPNSGVVNVYATARQHEEIQIFIDQVLSSSHRQVLIEATVVEIVLSDDYQAGVDWSGILAGHNTATNIGSNAQALQDNPSSPLNPFNFTHVANLGGGQLISFAMRALKKFGDVRIHSSPKIMAINNQMAVLKVADEQVYFELQYTDAVINASTGATTTPAKTTYTIKTVPIGLVMTVTPQISSGGTIVMTIRPSLTDVKEWKTTPAIFDVNNNQISAGLVPVVNVREMESSLRVGNGQTVILGGLMKNDVKDNQTGVPILGEVPVLGNLFRYQRLQTSKTELAVFLRPTIMDDDQITRQVRKNEHLLKNETTIHTLPKAVKEYITEGNDKD